MPWLASCRSWEEALLTEHKVTPLDMQQMPLRTERRHREAVERNYTELRRQQSGRGLTIALATPDGDELINCVVCGAVDDLNLATDAVPSQHPASQENQNASGRRLQLR
jgi:hypothetical protein